MSAWIKVDQAVPRFEVRCLVVVEVDGEREIMFARLTGWGGWIVEDDDNWPKDCVTHWFPLPELP